MKRARETAEIIASRTNSSISFDERLTEKNYRKSKDLYSDGTHIYVKFLPDEKKETRKQHLKRVMNFLQNEINILDKNLYIVGHGGLIRRIFEKISADKDQVVYKYKIPYCSVFVFKYNKLTKSLRYISHFDVNSSENL